MMKITYDLSGVHDSFKDLFIKSIEKMELIIVSPLFFENLKKEIKLSNNLEGELSIWKNKTPQEIYQEIVKNDTFHLILHTYYTWKNVIGYGYEGTPDIYVNTKYLANDSVEDPYDLMDIGSNLLHEHGHDLGFDHDFNSTYRRPNSICYILNRVYEKTYRTYYSLEDYPQETYYYIPWWKRILPWNWF